MSQLIVIDGRLTDLPALLVGFPADADIVIIDPASDGWAQLASLVAGRSGLDAIHILSHGSAGEISLGATPLNSANLAAHQADLAALGDALTADGDILLYGCSVGAGATGAELLASLATLTGADLAASNDLTGAAALGGDWTLEVGTGPIETASLTASAYDGVLADGDIIFGDTSGSGGGGGAPAVAAPGGAGGAGGGGNDVLTGSANNDVIFGDGSGAGGGGGGGKTGAGAGGVGGAGGLGGGGDDLITGGGGDDIIFGDGFNGAAGSNGTSGNKGGAGGAGGYGGSGGGGGGRGGTTGTGGAGGAIGGGAGIDGFAVTDPGKGGANASGTSGGTGGTNPGGAGTAGSATGTSQTDVGGTTYTTVLGQLAAIASGSQGGTGNGTGAGNDTLDGGAGSDNLFGLGGADTFVNKITDNANTDVDKIWDFNSAVDKLRIETGVARTGTEATNLLDGTFDAEMGSYTVTDVDGDGGDDDVTFTFANGSTLVLLNASSNGTTADLLISGDNLEAVCFLRGTRILTRNGYVQVEDLQPGDEVQTLNHGFRPLVWLGVRHVEKNAAGAFDTAAQPIRIRQDAFGAGLPSRDLLVSANHAVFFRNHLIPAKHLINGATVVRDASIETISYYHVLLDRHAVVFSEGLPTESYCPQENLDYFENLADCPAEWRNDLVAPIGLLTDCHPRISQGPVLETARNHLAQLVPAAEALRQVG